MRARRAGRRSGPGGRFQATLGLAVALGGAVLIWRLAGSWLFAWPLGFLLAAAGLYLMRTARDEDDPAGEDRSHPHPTD